MAKRKIDNSKPKVYRFMCMCVKCSGNYHMDFSSKDEALAYVESLNDPKIEWCAVYELDDVRDTLIPVISKRLLPYDDSIPKLTKEESLKVKTTRPQRKSK